MPTFNFIDSDTLTSAETVRIRTCFITSTRFVVCYIDVATNNLYADIYEISGDIITPIMQDELLLSSVRTTAGQCYGIAKVRDNMWIVIYVTASQFAYRSCYYNGLTLDTLSGTVDVNSANWFTSCCCRIAEDKIIASAGNSGGGYSRLRCLEYNGSTWSLGTTAGLAVYGSNASITSAGENKFLFVRHNGGSSKGEIFVGTVSGTTITLGGAYNLDGTDDVSYTSCCEMDSDKVIVCVRSPEGTDDSKAYAITISGLIPTIGSYFIFSDPEGYPSSCKKFSDNEHFMLIYGDSDTPQKGYGQICEVNWSTQAITSLEGEIVFHDGATGGFGDQGIDLDINSTDNFIIAFQDDEDANDILKIKYGEVLLVPLPPTGISVIAGSEQNTITFLVDDDADYTNIYWSNSPGVTKATGVKIADVTSPYVHSSLTGSLPYYYVLVSENAYGEGEESTEYSGTPLSSNPIISGTVGDSQNNIYISSCPGVIKYHIYWSLDSGVTKETGIKIEDVILVNNIYEHIDLTRQNYYYVATSEDIGGESDISNEICLKPDFEGKIFDHTDRIKQSLLYQYVGRD